MSLIRCPLSSLRHSVSPPGAGVPGHIPPVDPNQLAIWSLYSPGMHPLFLSEVSLL